MSIKSVMPSSHLILCHPLLFLSSTVSSIRVFSNAPVGDEEDTSIGSFVEDERTPGPADATSNAMLAEALKEILDTLTEREADVLRMRFGMYDGRTHTLEEVGQNFGVTRERIRQIENKAIRKLRHPSRAKKIKDFYC